MNKSSKPAVFLTTIVGLVVGAGGIAILWATGQEFPVYPPPGFVILLAGAIFMVFGPWRWTPVVGAAMGLFVTVGFLLEGIVTGGGFENLSGDAGVGRAIGQGTQVALNTRMYDKPGRRLAVDVVDGTLTIDRATLAHGIRR